jgi:hypothetical protein
VFDYNECNITNIAYVRFWNIGWVVDLEDVTSGEGSSSAQSVSVSTSFRSGKTNKLVFYAN